MVCELVYVSLSFEKHGMMPGVEIYGFHDVVYPVLSITDCSK